MKNAKSETGKLFLTGLLCGATGLALGGEPSIRTNAPYRITASADWIPFVYEKDIVPGSALDLSALGLVEAPAGRHGWLKAVGERFEFEGSPGVERRFFGANVCGDTSFPESQKDADALVDQLVRLGYNSVRIHHYDDACARVADGNVVLVPEAMAKLDRFLATCFRKGLYVTTDLFVSRRTKWREIGVDRDGFVNKIGLMTTPVGFANWCGFARAFLTHRNPYTGRTYAEEPGMPFIALINEASFHGSNGDRSLQDENLRALWRGWLAAERKRNPNAFPGYSPDKVPERGMSWWPEKPQAAMMSAFYASVERDFDRRATRFLREELGVKALLTGQNNGPVNAPIQALRQATCDYVDTHFYVDHPEFLGKSWSLPLKFHNQDETEQPMNEVERFAWDRLWGKPYTVSEYDYCIPAFARALNGPMTGAMAARQGWAALWRFAYAHGRYAIEKRSQTPYLFDSALDALAQASDRAVTFLFLRGDIPCAGRPLAENYDAASLDTAQGRTWDRPRAGGDAAWRRKVGASVGGRAPAGAELLTAQDCTNAQCRALSEAGRDPSPAFVDRARGTFSFESPRSCGVYARHGCHAAGALTVDLELAPAVVMASSLDGAPLETSKRILLMHLTDVQGDTTTFADATCKVLLGIAGPKRALMRRGAAHVALKRTSKAPCTVWALGTDGRRLEKVPSKMQRGELVIEVDTVGERGARMHYEIECP